MGARRFLAQATEEDSDWAYFLQKLSDGDEQAFSLARAWRPQADAGSAEALDTSVAQALPHAPSAVLGLAGAGVGVDKLCTSPFIEPEPGVEARYNRSALAALDALPAASRPQPAFDQCRAALARIGAELRSAPSR